MDRVLKRTLERNFGMYRPGNNYATTSGSASSDWRGMLALPWSAGHQLTTRTCTGSLERAIGDMQFDTRLACPMAGEHCIDIARAGSSGATSSASGMSPSSGGAYHGIDAPASALGEAHACITSMGELSLQSSMELDALFGEGLEPPTEADLQHHALLQLLQPGAGAGKPSSPQPAASLMAAVPAMYLHKLEPHPLAGMEADDGAPGRVDNGTDQLPQPEHGGQQHSHRREQQVPPVQRQTGAEHTAQVPGHKRPRIIRRPEAEEPQPLTERAQQAQQQRKGRQARSAGSGSSCNAGGASTGGAAEQELCGGRSSGSGAGNEPSASGLGAAAAAAAPAASRPGRDCRGGKGELTIEFLEREGLLDMPADEAAHRLGMGKGSLKAAGLRLGIERWPSRTRNSARNFLLALEEYCSHYMPGEEVAAVLRCAHSRLAPYLNAFTDTTLDPALAALRQRCYKLLHAAKQADFPEERMRKDVLRLAADIRNDHSYAAGSSQEVTQLGTSATSATAVRQPRVRRTPSPSGSSSSSGRASAG